MVGTVAAGRTSMDTFWRELPRGRGERGRKKKKSVLHKPVRVVGESRDKEKAKENKRQDI